MKFSVAKSRTDRSLPAVVGPDLVLIYAEDIAQMPTVDSRRVYATSELQLVEGRTAYSLYLTATEQAVNSNTEGETETRGWIHQVSGTFPGTELQVAEWLAANINQGFVAFRRHCSGVYKMYGSKYNPLFFTGNIIEDKEQSLCQIEFRQNRRSKVPYVYYEFDGVLWRTFNFKLSQPTWAVNADASVSLQANGTLIEMDGSVGSGIYTGFSNLKVGRKYKMNLYTLDSGASSVNTVEIGLASQFSTNKNKVVTLSTDEVNVSVVSVTVTATSETDHFIVYSAAANFMEFIITKIEIIEQI